VAIRETARYEGGHPFEEFADITVSEPYPGIDNKLQLLPPDAGNPAWVNPGDLAALGYREFEKVLLVSEHGAIEVIVREDKTLRPGVVSMSHCYGGDPQQNTTAEENGSCVVQLVSVDKNYDPLMGMPVMRCFPVKFARWTVSH
jgi:anaerobic selenocysteine-containing dehydrogenase